MSLSTITTVALGTIIVLWTLATVFRRRRERRLTLRRVRELMERSDGP